MKMVMAVVKPFKLDDVREALAEAGVAGITATEVFAKSGSTPFLLGVAFDDRDGDLFYDPGEGLGGLDVAAHRLAVQAAMRGNAAVPRRRQSHHPQPHPQHFPDLIHTDLPKSHARRPP